MNFYKNVIEHKGKLLIRGVLNGKDYKDKIDSSTILDQLKLTRNYFLVSAHREENIDYENFFVFHRAPKWTSE